MKMPNIPRRFTVILILIFAAGPGANSGVPGSCRDTANGQEQVSSIMSRNTIPYTLPWDDMPVDLSFVYKNEKPAGKHGFMKVRDDRFIFEDGTQARFWGTNFNSAQCFPSHSHSEKVARRLAKTGVNLVRFHQMDAEWSTPNIFQFTKGENRPNTIGFDPESMDRLDYLIYCLKEEGIYIYMDLLTYRRFKTGDGVENAHLLDPPLREAGKAYSTYNRRMIELQKKFNHDLWTRTNPYTRLAYKDDPAIVLTGVTNENDLFTYPRYEVVHEPYRTELEDLYREWARERQIKLGTGKVVFDPRGDIDMQNFFIDITTDYYREMIDHMRELGVKIPVSGTNWSINTAHLTAQMAGDFTDSHAYWYGWSWSKDDKSFMNDPMTGSRNNMLPNLAYYRVQDKPFFVSEWDNPWPNEWRAESSLLMAAAGALQGWGGFAIHTYRYTLDESVDMIGKPITSGAIGGIYYRGGVFDTFNDPAKFGLFYHAALITRRGDVSPAEKTVNIQPFDILSPRGRAYELIAEKHRVETVLPGYTANSDAVISTTETYIDINEVEVLSDTGELYRNLEKQTGWIDSPRTKAVYGFTGKHGMIRLTNLNINVKTDFATVAISSLTDEPITSSGNMLLTAVGRADNTNSIYNVDHKRQIDPGHGPVQVEIIEAAIEIETGRNNLRVFSINPQGFIIGYIPSEYKNGIFSFKIGGEYQSMYYLIQTI
jgi:hypothetical protein